MAVAWTRRGSHWHIPKRGWISLPPGMRTRRVEPGALSRKEQNTFQAVLKSNPGHVLIWLMNGVRAVSKDCLLEAKNMVDATNLEKAAMAAALRPLGEYVGSIGMNRPLADYSKDEVLALVEVVISAYQKYFRENNDDIPF